MEMRDRAIYQTPLVTHTYPHNGCCCHLPDAILPRTCPGYQHQHPFQMPVTAQETPGGCLDLLLAVWYSMLTQWPCGPGHVSAWQLPLQLTLHTSFPRTCFSAALSWECLCSAATENAMEAWGQACLGAGLCC